MKEVRYDEICIFNQVIPVTGMEDRSKGDKIRRGKKASQEAVAIVQERKWKKMNKNSAGIDEENETGSKHIGQKRWI